MESLRAFRALELAVVRWRRVVCYYVSVQVATCVDLLGHVYATALFLLLFLGQVLSHKALPNALKVESLKLPIQKVLFVRYIPVF